MPRGAVKAPDPVAEPVPTASIEVIGEPGDGAWAKIGNEGDTINTSVGTTVRYGANGKYVWAKVGGRFKADNVFFKRDPVVAVPKIVEAFTPKSATEVPPVVTPAPTPTPAPAQPGEALMDKVRELLAIVDPDVTVTVLFTAKVK